MRRPDRRDGRPRFAPASVLLFLPLVLTAVAPAAVASTVGRQEVDWDAVPITSEDLGNGIHVLFGRGGNIAVSAGSDGTLLVDDQYAPLTERILAAVGEITPDPVRFVVNTHWHGDHTGGNENLGRAGGVIVAHENVRRRMDPASFPMLMGRSEQAPPDALPVVTFDSGVTIHWNGHDIEALHQPRAHTDGDAAIFFVGADVIHMGDLFFLGRYPFIDVDSGGNIEGVIAAADAVIARARATTKIIPGHGPVTDRDALRAYRNALESVRDRIRDRLAAGMTPDGIVEAAAEVVSGLGADLGWEGDPERFVTLAVRSLAP